MGLATADFNFIAYKNGATWSHGSVVVHIAAGWYTHTYTTPPIASQFIINAQPINTNYRSSPVAFRSVSYQGEVEDQDLDSLYVRQARPVVTIRGTGTVGQIQPITLYNNRYRKMEFTFVDQDDVPIMLATTYDNVALAVRSADQSTVVYSSSSITTIYDSGLMRIEWPEDAGFFATAMPIGTVAPVQLYWEVTGNLGHDVTKTVSLIPSSILNLLRSEVGT